MIAARFACHAFLALCLTLTTGAMAQTPGFQPSVGQAGKDVVWVPTEQTLVDGMLDMAKVTEKDYVIDLGSGDGRTVITAAKRGARALGIEYNPDMVELSKRNAEKAGVAGKATFMKADIFESDFSQATVLTLFLLPSLNLKLRPIILGLKPGTRVVSNSFTMGEWPQDDSFHVSSDTCTNWCVAYLWIVPAKVEGTWKTSAGQLTLKQQFQMISGTLAGQGNAAAVSGKLLGEQISFTAGGATYIGRVNGDAIEGTVGGAKWGATRIK